MDAWLGAFDGPRARDAFLLQVVMSAPWSVQVDDEAPLTLIAVLDGGACALTAVGVHALARGDVLLVRDTAPYILADAPETLTGAVIGPGQRCSGPDGRDLAQPWDAGVRTWGNDPSGPDRLLVGTYAGRGQVGRLLLEALPPALVARDPDPALLGLLNREVAVDAPAQPLVLDRLLDLLLLASLRAWTTDGPGQAPAPDGVVQEALGLLRASPEAPWTLDALARRTGTSRSALTKRFAAVTGTSPMAYLTDWRLAVAADLLTDRGLTLAAVAGRVGYASPFSLSAAFKRRYGVSPARYREGTVTDVRLAGAPPPRGGAHRPRPRPR
ncbi:AraC family transcriptional regulator [Kineococcus endophyticus]|uniref:AraC family transcriptional regulator n=1 Tax=Kineococcus endophyticus TaxID=1181883 RepID=A0ABV3P6B5_9ACTN